MSKTGIEFNIQVVVEPDEEGFHAYCPALKGLHVDGSTESEALRNAREAATAYLESLIKHHDPVPLAVAVR
jgi:predicted RNase H-like HicB family nuclease